MLRRVGLCFALWPALAWAADVEIEIGQTKQLNVGASRGVMCDDLTIVSADMETDPDGQTNRVVFKGLKVGSTQCRVGNPALGSPSRLVSVSVHLPAK